MSRNDSAKPERCSRGDLPKESFRRSSSRSDRFRLKTTTERREGLGLSSSLAHEAGFQTKGDPIDLAGYFVVFIDQTDGLGF